VCAIVGSNFKIVDPKVLLHRGPDNYDIKNYKNVSLGHARLAIIDLDNEANQPMEFDDIVIVFNGEIYNYKELKKEHHLKTVTKSDTEVLIRLYQKYEFNFLNYLNGMFSFCIYDKKKDRFFCVRDRFGKKPFYYYFKNNKFIFASEIKAILNILKTTPQMNYQAFYEYLSFMTPINDNTFYQDIHKLKAGSYIVFDQKFEIKKYYDIDNIPTVYRDENTILSDIESILISSLKDRLVADVKIATLLSGGLDSSFISSLYAKYSDTKIDTFSIGYDEHLKYCELKYAKMVAKHIDSNHHEMVITKKDFIDTIEKMLYFTDEPFGDSASIPTFLLSKEINKSGIKAALSGEGSDESFLGYDNYFDVLRHYSFKKLNPKSHIYQSAGKTFTEKQKTLLLKNYKEQNLLKGYNTDYSPTKWVSYIDFKIWIAEVLMTKIDRMSMANSIELRSPFLDYRLVEYMLSVDEDIKKGNTNKYLLKKIAIKYLPKEIVYRKKKGFSSPFIEWLYSEYDKKILEILDEVNKEIDIFNMDFIKFLYNKAKEKRYKQHIWQLFLFAKWFKKLYLN